jgi:crotonobetainyl-CoA:carnitine CoA-transferase CaiB-like acyl-CoA transferase
LTASRALDGVLVVALEQAVAAPLCTLRLAAAGARVIKVEREDGDFARRYDRAVHGESAYFAWLNRGKQSIVLDIKAADDADLLHRLIARADVFVQNLLPGAADRAGFGAGTLRARRPRLITCDISGYGEAGPMADRKAYDLLIQCETGLASITGSAAEAGRVGVSVADIACGMNAHAAILQALLDRERTGTGAQISVSLFDALAEWMTVPLLHQDYVGAPPRRVGLNHPTIAPYGVYRTGDGKDLVLAVQNEREWVIFCTVVAERPDLIDDPRFCDNSSRCRHRGALDAAILSVFTDLTGEQLAARLDDANIAYGRVNSLEDLSVHPQLRRITVDSPTGPISMPAFPIRFAGEEPATGATPALNAHADAVKALLDDV